MRKKALSLALALALCLGLTVPAFAAEPATYTDKYIQITNVIDKGSLGQKTGKDIFGHTVSITPHCTCIAPVSITPGENAKDGYAWEVGKFPENLEDADFEEIEWINYEGETLTLTDVGHYTVGVIPNSDTAEMYVFTVEVQASSEVAPDVPTTDPTTTTPQTASPTNDALTADGVLQTPTVYKINGSNYFKIRDLAAILNGTSKQFSVGYDGALKSVTATTGQGYTKQPGDLAGAPAGGNKTAEPSNDAIYINGKKVQAEVYKIDGSNYFKLRDLGAALDFYVGYSAETGVFLETDRSYAG